MGVQLVKDEGGRGTMRTGRDYRQVTTCLSSRASFGRWRHDGASILRHRGWARTMECGELSPLWEERVTRLASAAAARWLDPHFLKRGRVPALQSSSASNEPLE
jgi:hypothetical protein